MDTEETEAYESDGKANTACSACRRRKLRCDRNTDGCSTCRKSDIPCIYTPHIGKTDGTSSTRDARRKPRGPYNKGKTPREKELEHVVELLTEKCNVLEATSCNHSSHQTSPGSSHGAGTRLSYNQSSPPTVMRISPQQHAVSSSKSSSPANTISTSTGCLHPSPVQILELWLIYTTQVDIMTKIIHCPSVSSMILVAKDNTGALNPSREAFMLSIYLAALNVLEPAEVVSRFGTAKEKLTSLYQNTITNLISAAYNSSSVNLEMLQATVIHMVSLVMPVLHSALFPHSVMDA